MRICNRSWLFASALVLAALLAADKTARSQQVGVFAADGYTVNSWCSFHPNVGQGSFFVVYTRGPYENGDYKTVRFALSLPSTTAFFFYGAWVLGQGDVPVSTLQSGVTVQLGPCRSDAVTVARVDYFLSSTQPTTCTVVKVVPDPSAPSGKVEFTRCDNELVYLNEGTIAGNISTSSECPVGPANPPSNPVPANGATGVNLDADLSVLIHWPSVVLGCFPLYGEGSRLFFGTNPNPPLISSEGLTAFPFDVGPLQPATTYYWRVTYINTLGANGISPTWSFTTAMPIATEPSTWGAVKALYRD